MIVKYLPHKAGVGCEFLFIAQSRLVAWSCHELHIGYDESAMREILLL